ncbi:unnamed protein product [Amoebophrya sp. A120]|nr:unnamed protein product [Amoebophrya sp. A120]|eukprot:GSA120T00016681001.1
MVRRRTSTGTAGSPMIAAASNTGSRRASTVKSSGGFRASHVDKNSFNQQHHLAVPGELLPNGVHPESRQSRDHGHLCYPPAISDHNQHLRQRRSSQHHQRLSVYSGADEITNLEGVIETAKEIEDERKEHALEIEEADHEQGESNIANNMSPSARMDVSEIPASWCFLIPMVTIFFTLYILQTFAFHMMKKNGLPWKGSSKEGAPPEQMWALAQDIPGYLAMCFVIYLPCKKTIWDLTGCQIFRAMIIAPADLVAQVLAKNGLAKTSPALYTIFSSGGSIFFTALAARFIMGKKANWLMWFGLLVMITGVGLYGGAMASIASNGSGMGDFMLGSILILLSSVADGVTFVLIEKFSNDGKEEIPGPLLTAIMGFTNLSLLLIWQLAYTLPRFDELIVEPMRWIYANEEPLNTLGKPENLFAGFLFLFMAGIVVRASTMYMLKQLGAVTFVVIKMMKIVAVVFLSSELFSWVSWSWWPDIQKFSVLGTVGASCVTVGVGIYSFAKIKQKKVDSTTDVELEEDEYEELEDEAASEDHAGIIDREDLDYVASKLDLESRGDVLESYDQVVGRLKSFQGGADEEKGEGRIAGPQVGPQEHVVLNNSTRTSDPVLLQSTPPQLHKKLSVDSSAASSPRPVLQMDLTNGQEEEHLLPATAGAGAHNSGNRGEGQNPRLSNVSNGGSKRNDPSPATTTGTGSTAPSPHYDPEEETRALLCLREYDENEDKS